MPLENDVQIECWYSGMTGILDQQHLHHKPEMHQYFMGSYWLDGLESRTSISRESRKPLPGRARLLFRDGMKPKINEYKFRP